MPLRLEELLRVALISVLAASATSVAFAVQMLATPSAEGSVGSDASQGSFVTVLVMMLVAWLYTLVPALFAGAVLHVVLRRFSLPRAVYLLAFALSALAILFACFTSLRFAWPLAGVTVLTAWLAYCFGPFALWRYEYEPTRDIDF